MPFRDRPDLNQDLARPDLAELALEGIVRAAAYRATTPMQAVTPATPILARPAAGARRLDELLFGEVFEVLDIADGFGWGRARRSGVVGHVALNDLSDAVRLPTHTVAVALSGGATPLPLNALVTVEAVDRDMARVDGIGDVPLSDLRAIGDFADDAADAGEKMLDAPYAPGGATAQGLDDRGLVRQALAATGRDLRQARRADAPRRGDLAVWPGHVAVMADDRRAIHASATHGGVVIEPISRLIDRLDDEPEWRRP